MHQISHPARHYIYYRLSTRSHTVKSIFTDLGSMGIVLPQDAEQFEELCVSVHDFVRWWKIPSSFRPDGKPFDSATVKFMRQWGIHGMWAKNEDVVAAEALLYEGHVRYALEVMLLGPLAPSTIAARIRERFSLSEKAVNTAVVRAFAHYFWDTSVWSPHQWSRAVFDWMPKGDKTPMLMALRAPKTPAGAAMVLAAADGDLETLEPGEMFQIIQHYGWRMFMQHATTELPSFPRTQAALAAFQITSQAAEAAERYRGGSKEIVAAIARIGVRHSNEVMPTVYDVPAVRVDSAKTLSSVIDSTAEVVEEEKEET